jgi:dolichol-phosphate mannosyltransferase
LAAARRFLSIGGNVYARALLGGSVRDLTGGYRAWSHDGLEAADPASAHASDYAFQVETALRAMRAGCTVVEHPIVFRDRVAGDSKMNGKIVREAMRLVTKWGLLRIYRQLP